MILVTGATGQLGGAVVGKLLKHLPTGNNSKRDPHPPI